MERTAIIINESFKRLAEVSLDERKRVSLSKALESVKAVFGVAIDESLRLAVYMNEAGQLLLSPEVSVPMHELWLYRNPEALKAVVMGLEEARQGKLVDLGSFAKYADDEID